MPLKWLTFAMLFLPFFLINWSQRIDKQSLADLEAEALSYWEAQEGSVVQP